MRIRKSNKPIVFAVIILLIIIILIVIQNSSKRKKVNYADLSKEELETAVNEKIDKINKIDLSKLNERERAEYYVSTFVASIENKNYETAYEMLYDEFKNNYFPSITDFEEYAKNKFPSMISLDYTNIERNDNIYILWITLSNPLVGKKADKQMNFVVRENDLNDFDISFSII